jgi:hypothetical protein
VGGNAGLANVGRGGTDARVGGSAGLANVADSSADARGRPASVGGLEGAGAGLTSLGDRGAGARVTLTTADGVGGSGGGRVVLQVNPGPTQLWLGDDGTPVAVCRYPTHVEVVRPLGPVRSLPNRLLEQYELRGVLAPGQLVALGPDGRELFILRASEPDAGWAPLTRARARIEALALSLDGKLVAWRDASGELGVYSVFREETVLRLHVDDAGAELR